MKKILAQEQGDIRTQISLAYNQWPPAFALRFADLETIDVGGFNVCLAAEAKRPCTTHLLSGQSKAIRRRAQYETLPGAGVYQDANLVIIDGALDDQPISLKADRKVRNLDQLAARCTCINEPTDGRKDQRQRQPRGR